MTGEQSHQTGPGPDQDDDFYVLGEDDSSETAPSAAPASNPSLARKAGFSAATGADEEDVLFSPTDAQRRGAGDSPFLEKQGKEWSGVGSTAEDIGIPVGEPAMLDEDPFADDASPQGEVVTDEPPAEANEADLERYAESGEFAVIDTNAQLASLEGAEADEVPQAVAEEVAEPYAAELQPIGAEAGAEDGAEDGAEEGAQAETGEEPVDDAWAPVEAEQDPLLETPGIAAAAEASVEDDAQVDDTPEQEELAATYGELAPGPTLVAAGAGAGYGRRRSRFLAAAAALLVCGGGGYFAWQEGWLGGERPSVVERAEIPRPHGSETPEEPPPVSSGHEPIGTPGNPDPTQQIPTPPPNGGENGEVPKGGDPVPDPVPGTGDPKPDPKPDPDPLGVPEVKLDPNGRGTDPGTLQVGEGLTIREAPVQEHAPVKPALNGIVPGSQAFAQLRNGNFFVGNVKMVDVDFVTLKLEKGEITLGVVDLKTIVPLASSEYQELKRVEQGFVRLNNRNRLLGTILSTQDENIILENKANRVVIPKAEIEELGAVGRGSVRFTDEDSTWVDRLVEKQMREREAETKGGSADRRGKKDDRTKVRSRIDEEPGSHPK